MLNVAFASGMFLFSVVEKEQNWSISWQGLLAVTVRRKGILSRELLSDLAYVREELIGTLGEVVILQAYESLTIYWESLSDRLVLGASSAEVERVILEKVCQVWELVNVEMYSCRCFDVEARYTGEDLGEVAEFLEVTADEIVRRHTAVSYQVAAVGFLKDFVYLWGVDESLSMPRKVSPRTSVLAGSLAMTGRQTAVYPSASPGGWNVIGHVDLPLYLEVARELKVGDEVKFRAV